MRSLANLKTLLTTLGVVFCFSVHAQVLYRQTGDSYVAISGTSTLHEWTMTSKDARCQASITFNAEGKLTGFQSLMLTVKSESLKSGHSGMDKNAYSTLNTDTYKAIVFELISSTVNEGKASCEGNLTVAGVTKKISVEGTVRSLPDKSLLISGSKKLHMSDFNVEAPTFMFGTVTTGDEITVSFNANLVPSRK